MDSLEEAAKELHGLRENFEALKSGVEGLLKDKGLGVANTSASHINVHGGGVAVWVAATACLVTLIVTIVASVFVSAIFIMQNDQMLEIKSDLNSQTKELREADMVIHAYINTGQMPGKEEEK